MWVLTNLLGTLCKVDAVYVMYGCSLDALSKVSTMYIEHTVGSHVHFITAFSLWFAVWVHQGNLHNYYTTLAQVS